MAFANQSLISALRKTAERLKNGNTYAWGNHGSCNCGNLLQAVTQMTSSEILSCAHTGIGEWTELAEEYCSVSNIPAYSLIAHLEKIGLTPTDIHNMEYLEDRKVLDALPGGFRWLKKNQREDVIVYFETFAALLEQNLIRRTELSHETVESILATEAAYAIA